MLPVERDPRQCGRTIAMIGKDDAGPRRDSGLESEFTGPYALDDNPLQTNPVGYRKGGAALGHCRIKET
jgi:hypothetical protein